MFSKSGINFRWAVHFLQTLLLTADRSSWCDWVANHPLPAIVVALTAKIDLLAVSDVAGIARKVAIVTVVRITMQKIGELCHMLFADVALGANVIAELDLRQAAAAVDIVIADDKLNTAGDFCREGVIMTSFTLHTSLHVNIVEV